MPGIREKIGELTTATVGKIASGVGWGVGAFFAGVRKVGLMGTPTSDSETQETEEQRLAEERAAEEQRATEAQAEAEAQLATEQAKAKEAEAKEEAQRAKEAKEAEAKEEAQRAKEAKEAEAKEEAQRAKEAEEAKVKEEAQRTKEAEEAKVKEEAQRAKEAEEAKAAGQQPTVDVVIQSNKLKEIKASYMKHFVENKEKPWYKDKIPQEEGNKLTLSFKDKTDLTTFCAAQAVNNHNMIIVDKKTQRVMGYTKDGQLYHADGKVLAQGEKLTLSDITKEQFKYPTEKTPTPEAEQTTEKAEKKDAKVDTSLSNADAPSEEPEAPEGNQMRM